MLSLYEKSCAAEFGFTSAEFCGLVTEVANRALGQRCSAEEVERFAESLRLEDLVLARACARGHNGAWERFLNLYREKLYTFAWAIARQDTVARELADSLYAELFGMRVKADGRRVSKLESYLGRGSLEGWLRTVLAQEYVNWLRRQEKLVAFDEATVTSKASSFHTPKAENAQLTAAIDGSLEELSSEERFLLAAYYLDGRTLAEIGRMVAVHESTVSRRVEKITANLRKRIVGRLRDRGFSKRAAEELLEADVRDLGVDVRNRLVQEREA